MKTPKGFFTYFHHAEVLEMLSDEQAGRLYKALMRYGNTGEESDFGSDNALGVMFALFKKEIDYNFERYAEICEMRREAGRKSAEARKKKAQKDSTGPHRLETLTAAELAKMRFPENEYYGNKC